MVGKLARISLEYYYIFKRSESSTMKCPDIIFVDWWNENKIFYYLKYRREN